MRSRVGIAVAVAALATTVACGPEWVPAPGAAGPDHYVSFGDSWVSGPLIGNQVGDPIDCGKSDHNFATLLAQELDVSAFHDASCGGANIDDLFEPHKANLGGKAPAQFDFLTRDTTLVTIGISGNDADIADSAIRCINLLPFELGPPPFGRPCSVKLTQGGVDKISKNIEEARAKMRKALAEVHRRAPRARVYVLGYGDAFPETGDGCWPMIPLLPPDVRYLRAKMQENNAMLASVAAEFGDTYVDLWAFSRGHDLCQPHGVAWINGITLDPPGIPAHPNALYHRAVADYLAGLVRADEHQS